MTFALLSGFVSTDQAAVLVLMGLLFSFISLCRGYSWGWAERDRLGRLNRREHKRIQSHDVSPSGRN